MTKMTKMTVFSVPEDKAKKKFPKNSYIPMEILFLFCVCHKEAEQAVLILIIATINPRNCAH